LYLEITQEIIGTRLWFTTGNIEVKIGQSSYEAVSQDENRGLKCRSHGEKSNDVMNRLYLTTSVVEYIVNNQEIVGASRFPPGNMV
jgi:hypothetical protein